MLTRLTLHIGEESYDLHNEDLQNWSDIECTRKRSDFGGVIRSFISKFEFVNHAYDLMMELFDRDGYNSRARVSMALINDRWEYETVFWSDLDFSTLAYDDHTLTISAIDASLSSIINANKSTKYEYEVGRDIATEGIPYAFDRLKMEESVTYEITDGESQEDGGLVGQYESPNNYRIYIGTVASEIAIGGRFVCNEDQEYGDGILMRSLKVTTFNIEWSVNVNREYGCGRLVLMDGDRELYELHKKTVAHRPLFTNDYTSIDAVLAEIHRNAYMNNQWANQDCSGWWVSVNGIVWEAGRDASGTNQFLSTGKTRLEFTSDPYESKVGFVASMSSRIWIKYDSDANEQFGIHSSSFRFSWQNRGRVTNIDCISPESLAERLLASMGAYAEPFISSYDPRANTTLLLPAESIRGLEAAKIYASFNDFCQWMETVFGYVCVLDEENNAVHFKHRKEIFKEGEPVEIPNVRDVEFSTNKNVLYSSLEIGYDRQDYDSANGCDEFNFCTQYMTDYIYDGKKLSMKSPFRADTYGIEFLCEKRGESTTDNSSDKDVFFVRGRQIGQVYQTWRSRNIENSITGTLINGEYSPMECVQANADYISLMAPSMRLAFASTEGNADISIDGVGMTDDLYLEDMEMLTAGELKFTTDCLDVPEDIDAPIRIRTADFIYDGYISEVNVRYARPEAAEYKMLIKYKRPCS